MITYVNKANADQYSFLYSKASEDLRTHKANGQKCAYGDPEAVKGFDPIVLTPDTYMSGRYYIADAEAGFKLCQEDNFQEGVEYFISDDITSLDEYFSYIVQLNEISRRYTILPLDEDVFEIDANTRMITVPKIFAQNGIGVQGDEVAEIVYFKIRRFFDSIDLATKNIYIQWRSAATDEKGVLIDGVSVPWVIDAESEPGYIIFGWPLSSKITAKAGNIQFAVRFYEFDMDKEILTYSLSTLTQTATIKPALDFNLPSIITDGQLIDDSTSMIADRFENSAIQNGVKALPPYYSKDLEAQLDLLENEEGFRNVDFTFDVQACSADGGQISYIWKKYSIPEKRRMDVTHTITMAVTKHTERKEGVLYFIPKGGDIANGWDLYKGPLDEAPENVKIYEKFSTGTIDGVGTYYVIATNRVKQSTEIATSTVLTVNPPVVPVLQTDADDLPVRAILEGESFDVTLKPNPTITDKGKLTFQWFRKGPKDDDFKPIDAATDSELVVDGMDPASEDYPSAANKATEGIIGDGYYKVRITNYLNKEEISMESRPCRVTHAATPCDISLGDDPDQNFTVEEIKNGAKLRIEVTIPDSSGENCQRVEGEDTIEYQWYRYRAGLYGNIDEDADAAARGEYVDTNGDDSRQEGANGPSFQPVTEDGGYYYCQVTNKYNGTTAVKNSPFFRIVNA